MLLRRLQDEARDAGKPLRIHVERFNPALRLYERLGFTPIADRGVYLFSNVGPMARRSREDDLVAHAAAVRADRHQEQIVGPQDVVLEAVDSLREDGCEGAADEERERHPWMAARCRRSHVRAKWTRLNELDRHRSIGRQANRKRFADPPGKIADCQTFDCTHYPSWIGHAFARPVCSSCPRV
jgi:hypothetical protein